MQLQTEHDPPSRPIAANDRLAAFPENAPCKGMRPPRVKVWNSCVEVSISGYPEIVRAQLAIPTELSILCGLAIGYPDPEFPANKLHIAREPIGENVVFLDN